MLKTITLLLLILLLLQSCTLGDGALNIEKRELDSALLSVFLSSEESNLLLFFDLRTLDIQNAEGKVVPLTGDSFPIRTSSHSREETLLWEGWLPPDNYKSLILRISGAELVKKGRKHSLMPVEKLVLTVNLNLKRGGSSLLFLRWNPNSSIKSDYLFKPAIRAVTDRSAPSTTLLYVSNMTGNNLTLVDKVSGTVVDKIVVGSRPRGLTVSSDGKTVYVANSGERTISVIDTATSSVINRLDLKTEVEPLDLGVSPDGKTLYAINRFPSQLIAIDAANGNPIADVIVSELPINLIVSPSGTRIFVASRGTDSISTFDARHLGLLRTIKTGASPQGMTFNEEGDRLFVTNKGSGTISIIDVLRLTLINTYRAGISPTEIAHDRIFNRLYVVDEGNNSLLTFDPQLGTVISINKIPCGPIDIEIDEGLRKAFVLCNDGSMVIINLPSERVAKRVWVGKDPYEIVLPSFSSLRLR